MFELLFYLYMFLEIILFVCVFENDFVCVFESDFICVWFLEIILFVWCYPLTSEHSPVNINFTLIFSWLNDFVILFYRKHSHYKTETLNST